MDLLKELTNLMGSGSRQSGAQQQGIGLENLLTGLLGGGKSNQNSQEGGLGALGSLLTPAILGGLVSAFMGKGGSANASGLGNLLGGLLGCAATPSLDAHMNAVAQADPRYSNQVESSLNDRVMRLFRAVIYAAKADGQIDQNEQNIINILLKENNVGPEGMKLIQNMMNEPLNPRAIAEGLRDSREAMQLYGISYTVCGGDDPAERRYLDSLAETMGIPANIKADIEKQVTS
jgi:uncharacterized membrane protein YebE (DUF533 family)